MKREYNKSGRPRVSKLLNKSYSSNKDYVKDYYKNFRYIFTVNLHNEKDQDIIEALESTCKGNRQAALKLLIRAGIKAKKESKDVG